MKFLLLKFIGHKTVFFKQLLNKVFLFEKKSVFLSVTCIYGVHGFIQAVDCKKNVIAK